jgi:hypothetical protein
VLASVYRVFQTEVGKEDFGPVQKNWFINHYNWTYYSV